MKIEKDFEFDQKKVTTLAWQSTVKNLFLYKNLSFIKILNIQ
jgi:hypothetical protein